MAFKAGPARPHDRYLPGTSQRALPKGLVLKGLIGKGTHATVWGAEDHTRRNLAVRVLHPQHAGAFEETALAYSQGIKGFPAFYESFEHEGLKFIVGENLEGFHPMGHAERMAVRGHNTGQAVRTTLNILRGLSALHAKGAVHADVYPHNLLYRKELGSEGVRIIDLGNARPLTEHPNHRADVDVYRTAARIGRAAHWAGAMLGHPRRGAAARGRRCDADRARP